MTDTPDTTPEPQLQEVEATPAQPETPVVPPPRVAEALQMLMDRENKIRETETAVKQQQGEIERARKLLEMAKANPLQFLHDAGTSYEDITTQVMQGNRPDPMVKMQAELANIRAELGVRQEREEASRRQAALDEARRLVSEFVDTSDQYPMTKAAGMQNLVFERIQDHYNKTGQTLSESSAAKEIEDYLSGVVDKLAELEAVRNRFTHGGGATESPDVKQLANTLTNAHSAANPTRKDGGSLTDSQSLLRAASLLRYVDNT